MSEFQPIAVLEHAPAPIDFEMLSSKREELIRSEFQPGGVWNQYSEDHLAFDVSLYDKNTSFESIQNDALGLITEKVSAEDGVVDDETRVKMQLTPPGHRYIQVDGVFDDLMVSPENLDSKKDVLQTITAWRNGVDLAAMTEVKKQFLGAKPGDMLFWYSGMAEDWEDPLVKCYNGAYGYLYAGRVELVEVKKDIFIPGLGMVEQVEERKELFVQDFKMDLNREASNLFLENAASSLHHTDSELDAQPLYESMTTVAKVEAGEAEEWDNAKIWRSLAEAKGDDIDSQLLNNLPVEVILGLQDHELQDKLKEGAAKEVAVWLKAELDQEIPSFRIQSQIKRRFIDATRNQLRSYNFANDNSTDLNSGSHVKDNISKYVAIYSSSSVSSGDSCGRWGGGSSIGIGTGAFNYESRRLQPEVMETMTCYKCKKTYVCWGDYCSCGNKLRSYPDP